MAHCFKGPEITEHLSAAAGIGMIGVIYCVNRVVVLVILHNLCLILLEERFVFSLGLVVHSVYLLKLMY